MNIRLTLIILVALLCCACPFGGKKRPPTQPPTRPPAATPTPTPVEEPSATPTVTPTPTPTSTPLPQPLPTLWPTPHPTPNIDAASYIPAPKVGTTVRLRGEEGEDYAAKIQAVMDNSTGVALVELGPGSLRRSIIAYTDILLSTTPANPLKCDQVEDLKLSIPIPRSDYGCIIMADGVHVSGNFQPPQEMLDYFARGNMHLGWRDPYFQKLAALTDDQIQGNYSTIAEPEFSLGPGNPGIIVFQALGDLGSNPHRGVSHNLAVTGIVIQGRQKTHYDGGVRQALGLGNCQRCTVQRMFLRDTGSIGIQAGGVSDEGNFSKDVVFTLNINSGGAAAHLAAVNGDNIYGFHNYSRRPGRIGWGGGVSAFDMETNSSGDHSSEVWIYNNLADYEGGSLQGTGSAYLAQDPYTGANRGTVHIVNNVAIGGRDDILFRYMSNGVYAVGLKGCRIVNNYVFRTGQNAVQMYNSDECLIQDMDFEHTGGGGAYTIQFYGMMNNTVRRANFRTAVPNIGISSQAGFNEVDGSCGNTYEDNAVDGKVFTLTSPPCRELGPSPVPVKRKFVSGSSWRGFTGMPLRTP